MPEPIYLWDESRVAVNAAEMALNNNWLVAHFEGQPDLWNTKPPLLLWLQVLSIKLFGFNEVAIRLPTVGRWWQLLAPYTGLVRKSCAM
ncbi:hypothetical protein MUN84_08455 [Hymenobacter sp. 5516J-16]|uniref:ArnT family glycosyltransferase n=1 Tax=Hymenobacter sp. 5516J-16 TaxID=2932253 RepID=UPI001FD305A7|nr:hypothetical protein [Hymenobacter sp. 5516J-16]UOQ78563.1 hypothetical protein MUN84_08455 [Hymenobacter sp. 5516J-16]